MRIAVVAGLLALFLLLVLVAPSGIGYLTPAAFLRIPIEGLLALAVVLVLPARGRRVTALILGAVIGLLGIVKIIGLGFSSVLDRPFDPVLDWPFLQSAVEFLRQSNGPAAAIVATLAAAALAAALVALATLAFLHLTRLAAGHRVAAARTLAVLAVAWLTCLVTGVQIVRDVPVAAHDAYDSLVQVGAGVHDRQVFAALSAVDDLRDTRGEDMLTALRGKDVVLTLIESYGRVAVEHPELAPHIGALLDAGGSRLRTAGFGSRSGFLTSPTAGGGSWLATATLMSGLWIDNQQRYRQLLAGDRLTLTGAFQRANWRTVAVMPGTSETWPEAAFFGYDRVYVAGDLGYHGPRYSFATMPDQFTLSAFQRFERAAQGHAPLMAAIPLISSHGPWEPVPPLLDWNELGDGTVFDGTPGAGDPTELVLGGDRSRVLANYRQAIGYSLECLVSYVETYGDDDLVLVFLGDHQPSPVVTGTGASRDVPITIVARDQAVLDRISGWGWDDGLRPGPHAPVWRMDTFRDRFLTAFGP